jgi:hypothetical protein
MQFDPQRAFPYPVLRPQVDDYVDGEFQAFVESSQSQDMQDLALQAKFQLSVPEIMKCIESGQAEFVLVVSCRETFYRERFSTESTELKVSLPSGHIRGKVEFHSYIVAKSSIKNFSSKWINPEFGSGPFSFEQASVLAVDRPQEIFIDREAFKPVSSIFELVKSENIPEQEWRLSFTDNKVQIRLHPAMKEKIDNFRTDRRNKAILINSLYFSAVMQCLSMMKSGEGYDEQRWAKIIEQQCSRAGIDLQKEEEYSAAQKLLLYPLTIFETYLLNGGVE